MSLGVPTAHDPPLSSVAGSLGCGSPGLQTHTQREVCVGTWPWR